MCHECDTREDQDHAGKDVVSFTVSGHLIQVSNSRRWCSFDPGLGFTVVADFLPRVAPCPRDKENDQGGWLCSLGNGGGFGCECISPIGQFRCENLTVRHDYDHVALRYNPRPTPNRNPDAGQTPNNTPSIIDPVGTQWEQRTPASKLTNPSYPLTHRLDTVRCYNAHRLKPTPKANKLRCSNEQRKID